MGSDRVPDAEFLGEIKHALDKATKPHFEHVIPR